MVKGWLTTHTEIMAHPAPPRHGLWQIARTPVDTRYPCVCELGQECRLFGHPGYLCRCRGRTDLAGLPRHCCAIRHPADRQGVS